MPYYDVGCYECGDPMNILLPYTNLDGEQLSLINQGQPFPVLKANICSETSLDQEQNHDLVFQGQTTDYEDYRLVCDPCGSESP
jgi:hypothetical protein